MLIEAFTKVIIDKILSDTCIYRKPNKNLPPRICLYFRNLNSRKSVWKRGIKTYSYFFSIRRSSIRDEIHRSVMTRAVFVCLLKVNFWEFMFCRLCQSSSQFENSRKYKGFLSSLTAALPIRKFCTEFLFAFIYFPPDINKFQKRTSTQPIWVIAFYGCRYTLIKNC